MGKHHRHHHHHHSGKKRDRSRGEENADDISDEILDDTSFAERDEPVIKKPRLNEDDSPDPLAALEEMVEEHTQDMEQKQKEEKEIEEERMKRRMNEEQIKKDDTDYDPSGDEDSMGQLEAARAKLKLERIRKEERKPRRSFFKLGELLEDNRRGESGMTIPILEGDTHDAQFWADAFIAGLPTDAVLNRAFFNQELVEEWLIRIATTVDNANVIMGATSEFARRLASSPMAMNLGNGIRLILDSFRSIGGCVDCSEKQPLGCLVDFDDEERKKETLFIKQRVFTRTFVLVRLLLSLIDNCLSFHPDATSIVPFFADEKQFVELLNTAIGVTADLHHCYDSRQSAPNSFFRDVTGKLRSIIIKLVDHANPTIEDEKIVQLFLGRSCLANAFDRVQTLTTLASDHTRRVYLMCLWSIIQICANHEDWRVFTTEPRSVESFHPEEFLVFLEKDESVPHFKRESDFLVLWNCIQGCVRYSGLLDSSKQTLNHIMTLLSQFIIRYSSPNVSVQYKDSALVFIDWLKSLHSKQLH